MSNLERLLGILDSVWSMKIYLGNDGWFYAEVYPVMPPDMQEHSSQSLEGLIIDLHQLYVE